MKFDRVAVVVGGEDASVEKIGKLEYFDYFLLLQFQYCSLVDHAVAVDSGLFGKYVQRVGYDLRIPSLQTIFRVELVSFGSKSRTVRIPFLKLAL